jgi:DNA-binding XRE family transcriptional regulator
MAATRPTMIETPKGERLVLLPEAEYRRLLAAAQAGPAKSPRRKAAVPVRVPAAIANRIFAGEHPVRVYREWRSLTAAALAQSAGLSAGHLSDIESGRRHPSAGAAARLARALGVSADDLAPAVT